MKKRIYRIAFVITLAIVVVDWPVKMEAGRVPKIPIGKVVRGSGLLAACSKEEAAASRFIEKGAAEEGKIGEEIGHSVEGARGNSKVETFIEEHGDDVIETAVDVYNENVPKVITCYDCGGEGAVYYVDDYGNTETDEYGNPILYRCPTCNGSGQLRQ